MKKLFTTVVVGGAFALLAASTAAAATLTVCPSGCQYTTIRGALSAAHDGDTISVGPGTYDGGFTIHASVRLEGAGKHSTTISGSGSGGGSVVSVARGAVVTIGDVMITGGIASASLHGGGIDNDGTLKLRESIVRDNQAGFGIFGGEGGGIYNDHGQLKVIESSVEDNTAQNGGGIDNDGGTLAVVDSVIKGNEASPKAAGFNGDGFGGGILNNGTLLVRRTAIVGNSADEDFAFGGGVYNGGSATLIKSQVSGNAAVAPTFEAAGAGLFNVGMMTLRNTPVSDNHEDTGGRGEGAGIFAFGQSTLLVNSPVTGNTIDGDFAFGGGISSGGRLTLIKSPVTANAATAFIDADGGGIFNTPGFVTRIDSPVVGNSPNDCVGC